MPTTEPGKAVTGKAVSSRNATTHGLFARDVVLPALGEDPEAYRQLEAEWMAQLPPRNLLERHYVEKIAAASWRLRRLHRWQAQLWEDDALTEGERMDRLDRALRHETCLHRQIDTAVKMLGKDAAQLFAGRAREEVLTDLRMWEGDCREDAEDARAVALRTLDHQYRLRKATMQAVNELSVAPLDAGVLGAGTRNARRVEKCENEKCENELPPLGAVAPAVGDTGAGDADGTRKCENGPLPFRRDPRRMPGQFTPPHPLGTKLETKLWVPPTRSTAG